MFVCLCVCSQRCRYHRLLMETWESCDAVISLESMQWNQPQCERRRKVFSTFRIFIISKSILISFFIIESICLMEFPPFDSEMEGEGRHIAHYLYIHS